MPVTLYSKIYDSLKLIEDDNGIRKFIFQLENDIVLPRYLTISLLDKIETDIYENLNPEIDTDYVLNKYQRNLLNHLKLSYAIIHTKDEKQEYKYTLNKSFKPIFPHGFI